jgi:arylsulfatase A-like enzyme
MKAVFVLFDSLNRHMLGPYGGTRVPTRNFDRLARRCVTFDKHYVGSLPCMPARRDILSGRLNFLHRSWGPMEPFDNALPDLLHQAGIYSHLVTDHFHYFEDGGATYHTRYDSYEFVRGQEGDRWKAMVQPHWERLREMYHANQFTTQRRAYRSQNMINREFIKEEKDFPTVKCFDHASTSSTATAPPTTGCMHLELFDPHEPFTAPARFKAPFDTGWQGPVRDWPRYGRVDELAEEGAELRANYYALMAFCDDQLGRLLDHSTARHVAGHRADPHHRPRLPAGRARFLGQEPHEPLRGDRAHPAVRPRSAPAARRARGAALTQAIDICAHGARPVRRRAPPR